MSLPDFSHSSRFSPPSAGRQRSCVHSAAAQLARRLSPGRAQTCSLSECFRVRIPSFTQAALAKTSIRSKNWLKPLFQTLLKLFLSKRGSVQFQVCADFMVLVERTLGFFQALVRKGLRRVNAETDHSTYVDGEFLQMNEP